MKKKSARKSSARANKTKKTSTNGSLISYRFIFISACLLLFVGTVSIVYTNLQSSTHVLGASTYVLADKGSGDQSSGDTSSSDMHQQSEMPQQVEPTNVPEVHQQVEQVQTEVQKQIENNSLKSVEVQPPQEGSASGNVILQQQDNVTRQLPLPASATASLTQITTPQAGTVSVRIGGTNTVTISNGPYTITTQFPVVVDPTTQTMAIRTPSGVTVIKTFPSQALQSLPPQNKLTSVSSIQLTDQQGTPVYETNGIQIRKFLGIIPVSGNVSEQINAQTGQVTNSSVPWYFSLFNFAFQSSQSA